MPKSIDQIEDMLRELIDTVSEKRPLGNFDLYEDLLDEIRDSAAKKISVNKRLPEKDDLAFVWRTEYEETFDDAYAYGSIDTDRFVNGKWEHYDGYTITHWMYVPTEYDGYY